MKSGNGGKVRKHRRLSLERLEVRCVLSANLAISEFLASNSDGLADEDGDRPDWIELHNRGASDAHLAGWYLTDNASDLAKWQLPAVTLQPDEYLVVFASGKDRAVAGGELHTNFALSAAGEYLALVMPDGQTVVHAFAPMYPPQLTNVSYGLADMATLETVLVGMDGMARATAPLNDGLGLAWTLPGFDDSAWPSGPLGVGFDLDGGGHALASVSTQNSTASSYVLVHGGLDNGALARVDRNYVYRDVPELLVGADHIRTANDDKQVGDFSMTVTVDNVSDVYLLIDNRVGNNNPNTPPALAVAMPWVSQMGFTSTGLQVGMDETLNGSADNFLTIYQLTDVPANTQLVFGAQNNTANRNMYSALCRSSLRPHSGRTLAPTCSR